MPAPNAKTVGLSGGYRAEFNDPTSTSLSGFDRDGRGRLLFCKAAIFLHTAVPATGFHAQGLPRAAIGHACWYRRTVRAFGAIGNAYFLLPAASHRDSERRLGAENAKPNQHDHNYKGFIIFAGRPVRISCLHGKCCKSGAARLQPRLTDPIAIFSSRYFPRLLQSPAIDT